MKEKKYNFIKILMRYIPLFFAASRILFIVGIILGMVHGLFLVLFTISTQQFFDAVTSAVAMNETVSSVLWFVVILIAVVIGSEVMNGLHNFVYDAYMNKVVGFLGKKVNEKTSRIEPVLYEDANYLDRINKAQEGIFHSFLFVFTFIALLTFYIPYILFMGIYLYSLKPLLALSLLFIFIPILVNQWLKTFVFAKLEDEVAPLRRELDYYEQCLGDREYFKETRILGATRFFRELYGTTLTAFNQKLWKAEYRSGRIELWMKLITLVGYLGVLYLLFTALLAGEISVGAFAAVFASTGMMFNILEELVSKQIGTMSRNIGSVSNFIQFLDLPERSGKEGHVTAGNGIVFDNVSFRYPNAEREAVKHVSIEIKKGDTVAIVGLNGAGKTTLIQLMTGLFLPTSGEIYIDGENTKEIAPRSLFQEISAVFQKYNRYEMTLAENIQISEPSSHEAVSTEESQKLKDTIVKAEIQLTEETYPNGIDTMLSREFDGVDLSGGQWQRIAIARGYYKDHSLILLDEPTAAIDPIEETHVYEKFAEIAKDKTAIIVTHRLGSAKIANRIIVMDQGEIIEEGSHEELMRLDGKYRNMYDAQARWYVTEV